MRIPCLQPIPFHQRPLQRRSLKSHQKRRSPERPKLLVLPKHLLAPQVPLHPLRLKVISTTHSLHQSCSFFKPFDLDYHSRINFGYLTLLTLPLAVSPPPNSNSPAAGGTNSPPRALSPRAAAGTVVEPVRLVHSKMTQAELEGSEVFSCISFFRLDLFQLG